MAGKPQYTNEAIKAALTKTGGLVYLAAKGLGCRPGTIYERAKVSPEVAECIKAQRGEFVDVAEQRLRRAVNKGEPWAVAMVLKTLGKDRGYVERQEVSGKDGGPLDVVEVIVRDRKEAVALLEYVKRDGGGAAANGEANGVPPGHAGAE